MGYESGHYYDWQGEPHHFVPCTTRDGTRPTTIADCRKHGWLPSVTTVLKAIAKPALTEWLRRTAAIAAVTTPRQEGESLDEFVDRVLSVDAEDESTRAKDLGSEIHKSIEEHIAGRLYAPQFQPYVEAAMKQVNELGKVIASEKTYVHPFGYAGKADCITQANDLITVIDFKTCKQIPKVAYPEAIIQTAALAAALGNTGNSRIQTAEIYISTTKPGETKLFVQNNWQDTTYVFKCAFIIWCYLNNYDPNAAKEKNSSQLTAAE